MQFFALHSVSLHSAVSENNFALVQLALKCYKYSAFDLNVTDSNTGMTPIMTAALGGLITFIVSVKLHNLFNKLLICSFSLLLSCHFETFWLNTIRGDVVSEYSMQYLSIDWSTELS